MNSVELFDYGVNHLRNWAEKERLNITADVCDILNLPFVDDTERNITHFYVDIEDIRKYFIEFHCINIPVEQT